MRKPRQPVENKRRIPRQARAEETVSAILEGAAQVLEAGGLAAFATNAVAERAGVSIGTLYQYFADKKSILIALARRELEFTHRATVDALRGTDDRPLEEAIRDAVRTLIKGFGGRQRARKLLIEALVANGLAGELARPVDDAMQAIAAGHARARNGGAMAPVEIYVMTRALIGAIRAAVMEQSPYLNSRAFEDELVRLIGAYVTDDRR